MTTLRMAWLAQPDVPVGGPPEEPVEPSVEFAEGPARLFSRFQKQGRQSAGLRVRALKAEMRTDMAMVTANCW